MKQLKGITDDRFRDSNSECDSNMANDDEDDEDYYDDSFEYQYDQEDSYSDDDEILPPNSTLSLSLLKTLRMA